MAKIAYCGPPHDLASPPPIRLVPSADDPRSQVFATLSHEFRTPLNAVIGFSEMILVLGPNALGERKTLEYAADIAASGRRLLALFESAVESAAGGARAVAPPRAARSGAD